MTCILGRSFWPESFWLEQLDTPDDGPRCLNVTRKLPRSRQRPIDLVLLVVVVCLCQPRDRFR